MCEFRFDRRFRTGVTVRLRSANCSTGQTDKTFVALSPRCNGSRCPEKANAPVGRLVKNCLRSFSVSTAPLTSAPWLCPAMVLSFLLAATSKNSRPLLTLKPSFSTWPRRCTGPWTSSLDSTSPPSAQSKETPLRLAFPHGLGRYRPNPDGSSSYHLTRSVGLKRAVDQVESSDSNRSRAAPVKAFMFATRSLLSVVTLRANVVPSGRHTATQACPAGSP